MSAFLFPEFMRRNSRSVATREVCLTVIRRSDKQKMCVYLKIYWQKCVSIPIFTVEKDG